MSVRDEHNTRKDRLMSDEVEQASAVLAAHELRTWTCICVGWTFRPETRNYSGEDIRAGHRTHVAQALAAANLLAEPAVDTGLRAELAMAQEEITACNERIRFLVRQAKANAAEKAALKADLRAVLASHAAMRAAIEALPARWEQRQGDMHAAYFEGLDRAAADLRAVLADPAPQAEDT